MFISLFVKNEYRRVFREKNEVDVITLYIWQRETCPLSLDSIWPLFWQKVHEKSLKLRIWSIFMGFPAKIWVKYYPS